MTKETEMMLPVSIEQKELFKATLKDRILDGEMNPMEFYRFAKIATDALDELKKDNEVFDCVMDEIAKYGKEKPVVNGAVITQGSRSTPNYDACNDPVYNELKEQLKAREKFLKGLPPEGTVDPNTGVFINPPTFSTSSYITVKL